MPHPEISIVIPVYRSAKTLHAITDQLVSVLDGLASSYEVIFVDDCSPDDSWSVLKQLKQQYEAKLKIVRLTKNHGQHNAILCGFSRAEGAIVVTMDDDLQNPPSEIPKLVAPIREGFDLAIGRYAAKQHSSHRNLAGSAVDTLQRHIFGLPSTFKLTSFRAISRNVIRHVNEMGGVFPYVTCMLLCHSSTYVNVDVEHHSRREGTSNYRLSKSVVLLSNLIFSYSPYPLYCVAFACLLTLLASLSLALYVVGAVLSGLVTVPGWASTVFITTLSTSISLTASVISLIYLTRISQQVTRSRVNYSISEIHE